MTRFQLGTGCDYLNLARTCKINHEMLIGRPWNNLHIHFPPFRRERSSQPTVRVGVHDGALQISSVWRMTRIRHRQCPMCPCEACEIEVAWRPINAYLDCQRSNVSEDLRELTISGWLPQTLESVNDDIPGHTFKGTRGVFALRPETLNIELHWATWSPVMLSSFDLTRLRSLKMPVRAPVDCVKIGAAFRGMPHLESLTITDLSDSQDFVNEFHHLGDGIMSLSSSLHSLDVTITNCNRAENWNKDEAFTEPGDIAFFFKMFFPEPSCHQIEALVRARYKDPWEPLDVDILRSSRGQLNLERLRFKHIGLPWWAFQTVFNPETIKKLDLPACRVAANVWEDLGKHAQLRELAHINYEALSGPFRSFLSTQHNLRFLSFARPPDIYSVAGIRSAFGEDQVDVTVFVVTEAAPHLGPGTEWGKVHARNASLHHYPSSLEFLMLLSNKTSLKHLIIPADMFDITPSFMARLARELPALESIELGFDYTCLVSQLPMARVVPMQRPVPDFQPCRNFANASSKTSSPIILTSKRSHFYP